MTFWTLVSVYCRRLKTTAKPSTLAGFEHVAKPLLAAFGPDREVESLKAADWHAYVEAREPDLSPVTIALHRKYLKAMLNAAVDEGLLERVPCKIRVPKIPRRDPPTLTAEECERLFKVAPLYVRPLLAAGLYCGLRGGESIALRVGDVDLERRELKVKARNGWSPKSRRERTVLLSAKALEFITLPCVGRGPREPLFRAPKPRVPTSRGECVASCTASAVSSS